MSEITISPHLAQRNDNYEWRYLLHGRVAHALRDISDSAALCGVGPALGPDFWYGSGSQTEYERAATLPACKHCQVLVAS